jgi:hypothetical protein
MANFTSLIKELDPTPILIGRDIHHTDMFTEDQVGMHITLPSSGNDSMYCAIGPVESLLLGQMIYAAIIDVVAAQILDTDP